MKKIIIAFLSIIILLIIENIGLAQTLENRNEFASSDDAIEWVKKIYLERDYEYGAIEGDHLIKKFPESVELHAWYIASLARSERTDEAVEAAAILDENNPENEWAKYAFAKSLRWDNNLEKSLKVVEQGLILAPNHTELQLLNINVLNGLDKTEEAFEKIDRYLSASQNPIRLMEMKGYLLYSHNDEREDITRKDMLNYFAEIRKIQPDNLSAHFYPGLYHYNEQNNEKALHYLQKAASFSTSPEVHNNYWYAVRQSDELSREEKIDLIEQDIQSLKEQRPVTANLLNRISTNYYFMNLIDKRDEYSEKIVEKFPNSREAEWVLVQQHRDYREKYSKEIEQGKEEIIDEYREMLWRYLNRQNYHNPALKGEIYLSLFYSYKDSKTVNTDTLSVLLEGMVEYNTMNPHIVFADAPAIYAEKGGEIDRALEIANQGFEQMQESVERRKEWGAFENDNDYKEALDMSYTLVHDALGWIWFHAGNLEKSEEHLAKSHNLYPLNRKNLYRLGKLYEKLQQHENAEAFYIMGVGASGMGENPNFEALRELYKKKRGSLEGYDYYLNRVMDEDRTTRKERILAEKIENPEDVTSFELKNMDGEIFNSVLIEDKITAINFWGTWCGPCVAEMPDIQELHEKYQEDDDVLILTINNDFDTEKLREWLDDHNYTFPVLRDDGYINNAGVSVFPTTWFLNSNGQIIYTQMGYTSELIEEFVWRIEALRDS